MPSQKSIIAVIGYTGMVGSVIFNYYKEKNFDVIGYAIDNKTADYDLLIRQARFVFIAVPTPFDWENKTYDTSILEQVLVEFNDATESNKDQIIIIKSTVIPGITQKLQEKFSNLKLIFNPEFLSEASAEMDFANPDRQIIGTTNNSKDYAITIKLLLPMSAFTEIMTSTEAEIIKYINNFYGSLMVIFSNLVYDICEKTGSDYDTISRAMYASKLTQNSLGRLYWNIYHGGYRGYGGKCFPKDMNSFRKWLDENAIQNEIVEATIKANERFLKDQNLTEQEVEKLSSRI